ncbi:hypothetical protein IHQ71_28835 (plasmid) [Rhizobium sp. TH2]|uniref:hypothetical protein n=1 Tax=Rhizobium sp. TH2 TaxID=2775403 RepID=UPI0021583B24|nr:hypothetical protein [Rhizobium sp. TH2]UVC12244.1 hypothetical protein IHQ71_28835 [Rhizobium sp. TH2]
MSADEIRPFPTIASSIINSFHGFKKRPPVVIQTVRSTFDEAGPMFLDADDIISLHSQISELQRAITQQERFLAELQRLNEPTALAAKFLARSHTRLSERQKRLARLTDAAANEDT